MILGICLNRLWNWWIYEILFKITLSPVIYKKNGHLLEMAAKFDHGQSAEHAILIHDKMTVNKHEQIAFHEQKVGAILDR